MTEHVKVRLRYRVLTGPSGDEFNAQVSAAIDDGYELHGSPSIAFDGERTVVAQALILPAYAAGSWR